MNLRYLALLVICLFGAPAVASDMEAVQDEFDKIETIVDGEQKKQDGVTSGVRATAFFDSANKGVIDTTFSGVNLKEESNYSVGFGLGLDYSYRSYKSLGFQAGVAYEFPRELKSFEGKFSNGFEYEFNYPEPPKLSYIILQAGTNYSIREWLYLTAGLNYNLPSYSTNYGRKFDGGGLGYEFGLGARVAERTDIEVAYQKLNFQYDSFLEDKSYSIAGFKLKGSYYF